MTEILYDAMKISMTRDPQSGELTTLSTDDCTLRYHRNGPLVQRQTVTSRSDSEEDFTAIFDYEYDSNLRLESLQVCIFLLVGKDEKLAVLSASANLLHRISLTFYQIKMIIHIRINSRNTSLNLALKVNCFNPPF